MWRKVEGWGMERMEGGVGGVCGRREGGQSEVHVCEARNRKMKTKMNERMKNREKRMEGK